MRARYLFALDFGVRGKSCSRDTAIVIALVAVALVGVTVYMFLLAHQQDVLCGLGYFTFYG